MSYFSCFSKMIGKALVFEFSLKDSIPFRVDLKQGTFRLFWKSPFFFGFRFIIASIFMTR